MSKETLTPWRYYPQFSEIVDRHGCRVALVGNEQKASLILNAVNNHDRLVEALEKIVRTAPIGLGGWDALLEAKQLLTN